MIANGNFEVHLRNCARTEYFRNKPSVYRQLEVWYVVEEQRLVDDVGIQEDDERTTPALQ